MVGKRGQGGNGLADRRSTNRYELHAPEFIRDRPVKVTLNLCRRASLQGCCVCRCVCPERVQTFSRSEKNKQTFEQLRTGLPKDVPEHEQLFVLIDTNDANDTNDTNTRTGRRGGVGFKVENIVPSAPTVETHSTKRRWGKESIDYILSR